MTNRMRPESLLQEFDPVTLRARKQLGLGVTLNCVRTRPDGRPLGARCLAARNDGLVFLSTVNSKDRLWVVDMSGDPAIIKQTCPNDRTTSSIFLSPDGKRLLFVSTRDVVSLDLPGKLSRDTRLERAAFSEAGFFDLGHGPPWREDLKGTPTLTPDGKFVIAPTGAVYQVGAHAKGEKPSALSKQPAFAAYGTARMRVLPQARFPELTMPQPQDPMRLRGRTVAPERRIRPFAGSRR